MTFEEFKNWIENESSYKFVKRETEGTYVNYTQYKQGMYRTVELYDDGSVKYMLLSSVEFDWYLAKVEDFEKQKDGSLKVSIWVENDDGNEVEEIHYLYQV